MRIAWEGRIRLNGKFDMICGRRSRLRIWIARQARSSEVAGYVGHNEHNANNMHMLLARLASCSVRLYMPQLRVGTYRMGLGRVRVLFDNKCCVKALARYEIMSRVILIAYIALWYENQYYFQLALNGHTIVLQSQG
jgi:hypothetical protein